jgi:hypothetical protein
MQFVKIVYFDECETATWRSSEIYIKFSARCIEVMRYSR